MLRNHISVCLVITALLIAIGCQGGKSPLIPDPVENPADQQLGTSLTGRYADGQIGAHHLLGLVECRINFETGELDVLQMRTASQHLNLVQIIPIFCKPPSACLDFVNLVLDPVEATAELDVVVNHPIPDPFTDIYDMRGIMIVQGTLDPGFTEGSIGTQLINADGYTTAYDETGLYDAFANPYITFNKNEPNRIFENGSTSIEHFSVQFPSMEGDDTKFLYALDASWVNVDEYDPEDPLTHPNIPEPYQINLLYVDPIKDVWGAEGTLVVETFDWQENAAGAEMECPDLFGGAIEMTEVWSGDGRYLYYANLINDFDVPAGLPLPLLVKAWDEFPSQPDLLNPSIEIDLTNYQLGQTVLYESAFNTAPVASVVADELIIIVGASVHFDASLSNDAEDGAITSFQWDFDGDWVIDLEDVAVFDHQFDELGIFPVNVIVTDSGGLTDILDLPIVITVIPTDNTPPVALAFANITNPWMGQQVTLDASASYDLQDGTPSTYDWDLDGDQQYDDGSGVVVFHSWNTPGIVEVDVLVKDSEGLGDVLDEKIIINVQDSGNTAPTAVAIADKLTAVVGEEIEFDGTGSFDAEDGSNLLYEWDMFGNETYSDYFVGVVYHKYWAPSTYDVDLRVTDTGGLTDTLDVKLEIEITGPPNQPPVAIAEADKTVVQVMEPIYFDATASYDPEEGTVSIYRWDLLGDGNYVDAFTPDLDWFYFDSGEYNVDVKVYDTPGAEDTLDVTILIQVLEEGNHPPIAHATADQLFVYEGDTVVFNGSGSTDPDDGSPMYWAWDLDSDGQYDDSPFVISSQQFNTQGEWPIDLKVTDKDMAWDTLDDPIIITVVPVGSNFPPNALGEAGCEFPMAGQPVQFNSYSTDQDGVISKWEWDFYEGSGWEDFTDSQGNVWHSFEEEGIYFVNHRVTDDVGASDEFDSPINIFVTNPLFQPPTDPPSCPPDLLTHTLNSSGKFESPNTTSSARDLAYAGNGSFLAVLSDVLYLITPPADIEPPALMYGAGWVQSIDVSKLGLVALAGLNDGIVKLYSLSGGDPPTLDYVKQIDVGATVSAVAFDNESSLWVYAEGVLSKYRPPLFNYDACGVFQVPLVETYGQVNDMEFSVYNHSMYLVLNDGAGGAVVEVDHMGNIGNIVTDVLDGESHFMDIIIDNDGPDTDMLGCRIEVFGGTNQALITRLDADLNVLARSAYGYWGARAASLNPEPGNEIVVLEDCCLSWIDLLIPPDDWKDGGGGG